MGDHPGCQRRVGRTLFLPPYPSPSRKWRIQRRKYFIGVSAIRWGPGRVAQRIAYHSGTEMTAEGHPSRIHTSPGMSLTDSYGRQRKVLQEAKTHYNTTW